MNRGGSKMTATDKRTWQGAVARLFGPAVWALNRLRYAPKFLVLGLLLAVPFSYVTMLQYQGVTHDIAFNHGEVVGVRYLTPVKSLMDALQRHRLYAAAVVSDPSFKPQ